jgi:hypothetical protein
LTLAKALSIPSGCVARLLRLPIPQAPETAAIDLTGQNFRTRSHKAMPAQRTGTIFSGLLRRRFEILLPVVSVNTATFT